MRTRTSAARPAVTPVCLLSEGIELIEDEIAALVVSLQEEPSNNDPPSL